MNPIVHLTEPMSPEDLMTRSLVHRDWFERVARCGLKRPRRPDGSDRDDWYLSDSFAVYRDKFLDWKQWRSELLESAPDVDCAFWFERPQLEMLVARVMSHDKITSRLLRFESWDANDAEVTVPAHYVRRVATEGVAILLDRIGADLRDDAVRNPVFAGLAKQIRRRRIRLADRRTERNALFLWFTCRSSRWGGPMTYTQIGALWRAITVELTTLIERPSDKQADEAVARRRSNLPQAKLAIAEWYSIHGEPPDLEGGVEEFSGRDVKEMIRERARPELSSYEDVWPGVPTG